MIDVGIVTIDLDLKITDWNKWIEYRSGKTKESVLGKNILKLYPNLDQNWFKNNCQSVKKFGNYAFFSQKLHQYCIPLRTEGKFKDQFNYMQQNCTLGPLRNEKRKVSGFFLMINDVTEISNYELELTKLANIDGLTGIYNRMYFERRIQEEYSRHIRFKGSMSIVMLDIDFFKNVNDTLGHQYGDFVLKQLAFLIKNRIRQIDILARYGGEEFILILPGTKLEQGLNVAETLRQIIEENQFDSNGILMKITISLGVSALSNESDTPELLVKQADDALYLSKENGRNKVSSIVSENK